MNILDFLILEENKDFEAYKILKDLLENKEFYNMLKTGIELGYVRGISKCFFDELDKLNIMHPAKPKNFSEYFKLGLNIGNCTNTSQRMSYALPYCEICGGTNKYLIDTQNSKDGSHTWISYNNTIIDPTFMLVIDSKYATPFGYNEEKRINPHLNNRYNSQYEFANDRSIK